MFVCVCNGITERQIREAIDRGAVSLQELTAALGVAAGCGTCATHACELLNRSMAVREVLEAACPA